MADDIRRLPTTNEQPSPVDIQIMQSMFGNSALNYELKRLVVPAITFFVLNLYAVDEILRKLFSSQSDIVFMIIKTVIFIGVMVVAQLLGWA